MNTNLYITSITLQEIAELIKKDKEFCGNGIIEENGEVKLISNGSPLKSFTRKNCMFKEFSTIIWHTHAYSSKSYPSLEDIIMIVKNNVIVVSLIFTNFGVWKITSIHNQNLFNAEKLNKNLDNIYFATERGRNLKTQTFGEALLQLQNEASLMGVGIYFTDWDDILNEFVL